LNLSCAAGWRRRRRGLGGGDDGGGAEEAHGGDQRPRQEPHAQRGPGETAGGESQPVLQLCEGRQRSARTSPPRGGRFTLNAHGSPLTSWFSFSAQEGERDHQLRRQGDPGGGGASGRDGHGPSDPQRTAFQREHPGPGQEVPAPLPAGKRRSRKRTRRRSWSIKEHVYECKTINVSPPVLPQQQEGPEVPPGGLRVRGEAAQGPAAGSGPHHPQRPVRRRPAGGGRHLRLGREGPRG